MCVKTWIVFSGPPRQSSDVRRAVDAALRRHRRARESLGANVAIGGLDFDGVQASGHGIEPEADWVERVWLVIRTLDPAVLAAARAIAAPLDWTISVRWGKASADGHPPPDLTPLLDQRATRDENRVASAVGLSVVLVAFVLLFHLIGRGVGSTTGALLWSLSLVATSVGIAAYTALATPMQRRRRLGEAGAALNLVLVGVLAAQTIRPAGLTVLLGLIGALAVIVGPPMLSYLRSTPDARAASRAVSTALLVGPQIVRELESGKCPVCGAPLADAHDVLCSRCERRRRQGP